MNNEAVENYLATLTGKNPETLRRERKTLLEFLPFLSGQTAQAALDAFQQTLEAQGNNAQTVRRYRKQAANFCRWMEQGAEQAPIGEGEAARDSGDTQHDDTPRGNAEMKGADAIMDKPVRRPGRPKRTDGKENRSQKFSLYLPPTLYTSLDELARFRGCSITDILIELAEVEMLLF